MEFLTVHNLFNDPAVCLGKEFFETMVAAAGVRLERIVSYGQSTAAGTWLQQADNEWVLLLSGRAKLALEQEPGSLVMEPGDHIMIAAGCRHRVEWTDPVQTTIWLALHFPAAQEPKIKDVKVIRTRRRRRSASARMVKDTLLVRVPHRISEDDLQSIIKDFMAKIEKKLLKKQLNADQDLVRRAKELNKEFFSGKLRFCSIEYVTDQNSKFGCCDHGRRKIRISHHVAAMPAWVRDYVLVHELSHLVYPDHGADFWRLVAGYKHTERAKGYLLAKGYELNDQTS
jgi:predicted metal-dependent hydrolase